MSDDFDSELRSTLRSAAGASRVPDGLAERLVANARSGRTTVVPIRGARRASRWTAPLLAAAAVLIVVGGSVTVAEIAAHRDDHGVVNPPVAPTSTSSVPTPSPSASITRSGSPTRRPTATPTSSPTATGGVTAPGRVGDAPADFRAADVYFRDAQHGEALGVEDCAGSGNAGCKVRLIATDDGGGSWYRLNTPSGLHSMFPTTESDGSCADNGDILGPCVDGLLFADAQHGYLYGLHAFYTTDDSGRTWHKAVPVSGGEVNVPTMALGDGVVYRLHADHGGSSGLAYRVQRAAVGSSTWADVSPADVGIGSQLVVQGRAIVLTAAITADTDTTHVYRSADGGADWTTAATTTDFADGAALTPDGTGWAALVTKGQSCVLIGTGLPSSGRPGPGGGCSGEDTWRLVALASTRDMVVQQTQQRSSGTTTLYRSTDGGASFHRVLTVGFDGSHYGTTAQFDGLHGWLVGGDGRLRVTTDGGATWASVAF